MLPVNEVAAGVVQYLIDSQVGMVSSNSANISVCEENSLICYVF